MTIYDKAGIPILGREDNDSGKKIQELSQSVLMAKGIVQDLKERLELSKAQNANLVIFLIHLMGKTENNRFRVSIKELDSLMADFLNDKFRLKTYKDQAKNIVIYREDVKKEKEEEEEKNGKGKK